MLQVSKPDPKVLIVKLSAIGDCVLATPVVQALRGHFPQAHIAWVVSSRCRSVVEGNPFIDEWIELPTGVPPVLAYARTIQEIRRRRFDLVLDLQGIFKSSVLVAGSGAKVRITGNLARSLARRVATHVVDETGPDGRPQHPTFGYLARAYALGVPPGDYSLHVPVSAADRGHVRSLLSESSCSDENDLVVIHPGCADGRRRWPAEGFAAVADALSSEWGARILLTGAPGEESLTAEVAGRMRSHATNLAGRTTLNQLAALLERCRLLIVGDTGPLHIGQAVGVPLVALFGPVPSRVRLLPRETSVAVERNSECQARSRPGCARSHHCRCLEAITVDDVLAAVRRVWDPGRAAESDAPG